MAESAEAQRIGLEHHGDAAAVIFAFTASPEARSTERASLGRERTACREQMKEAEGRRKRNGDGAGNGTVCGKDTQIGVC